LNEKEQNSLASGIPAGILQKTYETEEKVAELIEDGEIKCPCHSYIGEEAVAVGFCSHLGRTIISLALVALRDIISPKRVT
jgi:hypothetical protein